jgi:hypothetical protein
MRPIARDGEAPSAFVFEVLSEVQDVVLLSEEALGKPDDLLARLRQSQDAIAFALKNYDP